MNAPAHGRAAAFEARNPFRAQADAWRAPARRNALTHRFALVLGSGGVKSIAGLGAAAELAEAGLQPDLYVGCSAGAMFGALLAAGHTPQAALEVARRLWSPEVTRRRDPRAVLELLRAAWPRAPWGLGRRAAARARETAAAPRAPIQYPRPPQCGGFAERFALRDDRLIGERLAAAFGDQPFEDLCWPLRVRATCAATGTPVLLQQGRIRDALRASIALPFLFRPGWVDGRPMIDGSVSDPLPLGAATDAAVVLGVGFEVPLPRSVEGPTRMATRITASLSNALLQATLSAHAGPDCLVLLPKLERRVGLFETSAMPALWEAGRRAVRAVLPELQAALAAADARSAAWAEVGCAQAADGMWGARSADRPPATEAARGQVHDAVHGKAHAQGHAPAAGWTQRAAA